MDERLWQYLYLHMECIGMCSAWFYTMGVGVGVVVLGGGWRHDMSSEWHYTMSGWWVET